MSTVREGIADYSGPTLFTSLPASITNITDRPGLILKVLLDKYLPKLLDQPPCGEYLSLRAAASDSSTDHRSNTAPGLVLDRLVEVEMSLRNGHKV